MVDRSSLIGRDAANGETFVDARDVQVARHVVVHGAETNWPSFQSRPDPPPGATVEYTLTFKRPHDCAAAPAVLYIGAFATWSSCQALCSSETPDFAGLSLVETSSAGAHTRLELRR